MPDKAGKVLVQNRKAWHDYFVENELEAGMELVGTEVKSIRMGHCNLKDTYVAIEHGEAWVQGMHISPYEKGNIFNRNPMRPRKLLLHKREILQLSQATMREGMTLVPLDLHLVRGRVKMRLGVCKGKKTYDKRADIAGRDAQRDIDRALRERQKQ